MRAAVVGLALVSFCVGCDPEPPPRRDGGGDDAGTTERDAGDPTTDGDGDSISDLHEGGGAVDTDADGTPDTEDLDSDGDGYSDAEEAGDADVLTAPVDTDADGTPDFRDLDSDGDGLPDASERMHGTDPRLGDSDGDGVSDLVEVVAMTDPSDATSSPRARGDFFFVVPYEAPPSPPRDSLVFRIEIRRADVYFMIDSSVSMRGEITQLRDSLATTVFDGVRGAIPDAWLGAGHFDQCPNDLRAGDYGIVNAQGSTDDVPAVVSALDTIVSRVGGGPREPYGQAAWLFATGDHTPFVDAAGMPRVAPAACPAGTVGYGCVRPDALPILVMIGDEAYTQGDGCTTVFTTTEVATALNAISAKVVVIGRASTQWTEVTTMTGSTDATGTPYVFPLGGGTIDTDIVDAITTLASSVPLDLTARARDADDDGVDATIFIERLEANETGGIADPRDPSVICLGGLTAEDRTGDGFLDTFLDVPPATPVCFDVVVRMNTSVMPTDTPQVFRAQIDVLGDGVTVLDTRDVFFLVPPAEGTIVF